MTNRKFIAFVAILLAFAMLFSAFYIILEADHDCDGEDCAICAQICLCENILRQLALALLVLALAHSFRRVLVLTAAQAFNTGSQTTLVTLKVKLSN